MHWVYGNLQHSLDFYENNPQTAITVIILKLLFLNLDFSQQNLVIENQSTEICFPAKYKNANVSNTIILTYHLFMLIFTINK